jgi:tRNA nucleotidyltransferase (CCA-adding enzyme)
MFPQVLRDVVAALQKKGGKPFLVGGAVRDMVSGNLPKDLDIEVFGLPAEDIISVASQFGKVNKVGASFGVIILKTPRNPKGSEATHWFDISIPRRESKEGRGHKGFIAKPDPSMTPEEAASRRDFTFNAMMFDFEKETILDFFQGTEDLDKGILRHIGPAFDEDPLRVLRGFQFAGRFEMKVDPETASLCQHLFSEYSTLAQERIWNEWLKWATKSTKPSMGLKFLVDTGWIKAFPSIESLIGVPQSKIWHPEGDVFEHTCHTVDAAMDIARRENIWGETIENQKKKPAEKQGLDRAMLVLSALCHDFGKDGATVWSSTNKKKPLPQWIFQSSNPLSALARVFTSFIPTKEWTWRSPGHGTAGVAKSEDFLQSIGCPVALIDKIKPLVAAHLDYLGVKGSKKVVRRLANRIHPATIQELCWLIEADHSGRPPLPKKLPEGAVRMLEVAGELRLEQQKPKPLLMGRVLLSEGLMKPGPEMGKLISESFQAQLDGAFSTPDGALAWAQRKLNPEVSDDSQAS